MANAPSFGRKFLDIVATVAPTVATLLGGPLAGMAVAALSSAFGTSDTKAIEQAVVAGNPDALVKLKETENQTQVQLKQLDIDLEKLNVEDRGSARHLAEIRGFTPQIILSSLYTVGYFAILILFMMGYVRPPPQYAETMNLLLGVLTTAQVTIMAFWFGSSSGSQAKTQLLSEMRERNAT